MKQTFDKQQADSLFPQNAEISDLQYAGGEEGADIASADTEPDAQVLASLKATPPKNEHKPANAKEQFYDKLPFTYRQVDIFVKIMIGATIALLVFGIVWATL